MIKPELRAAYDDHMPMSQATGLYCEDPSRAQQHQKEETDINNIVRKYMQTGELPVHNMPPLRDDFGAVESMQDAMDLIVAAKDAFMQQPADVRSRFHNDPAEFVEFCSKEENRGDMIKMGLMSEEFVRQHEAQQAAAKAQAEKDRADAEAFRKGQGPAGAKS